MTPLPPAGGVGGGRGATYPSFSDIPCPDPSHKWEGS